MPISSEISSDGSELKIHIEGRFDLTLLQEFRDSYEQLDARPTVCIVNMEKVSYIDSAGLGTLLLLKDYIGGDTLKVKIINCNDDVKHVLTTTSFAKLFHIH